MRIEPLGDEAYILRDLEVPPYRLAEYLNNLRPPGLVEATASYHTVGLYVDPNLFDPSILDVEVGLLPTSQVIHEIPVCFEMGEDLESAAVALQLDQARLIELFCGQTYTCFAIGFSPGFPYLGYLPPELQGLDRLPSPRLKVPAGSVAVTGDQAGIYPSDHAGGWQILGRTPLTLVDERTDYFPISAGHQVRFAPINRDEFEARRGKRL